LSFCTHAITTSGATTRYCPEFFGLRNRRITWYALVAKTESGTRRR
jgi:hypothetical protein